MRDRATRPSPAAPPRPRTTSARRLRMAVAAVAASVLLAASCGDDAAPVADDAATTTTTASSTTTTSTTTTTEAPADGAVIVLEIVGDQLEGGVRREKVPLGDQVTIVVTGDSTDEVHVHGYDHSIDLADDAGAGELTFEAVIPGIFEVELEGSGRLLIELEVS